MKDKILYIDPPEGWKYGFPKPVPHRYRDKIEDFLLLKGYPKTLIDLALKYSRYWEEEFELSDPPKNENKTNS